MSVIDAIRRRLSELERKALAAIADIAAVVADVADHETRITVLEGEAWTNITYQNSWVNFGGGYQEGQFRLAGDMVQVRGTIKDGTVGGVTAFTLPAGYRPPATIQFAIESAGAHGKVEVQTDGDVQVVVGSNVAAHINFEFCITA